MIMSKTSQILIGVLITVIIIGAVWYGLAVHYSSNNSSQVYPASSSNTAQTNPASSQSGTTINNSSAAPASGTTATDNSDASINQDLQGIDTQMNGMSSDNSTAQQSLIPPQQ